MIPLRLKLILWSFCIGSVSQLVAQAKMAIILLTTELRTNMKNQYCRSVLLLYVILAFQFSNVCFAQILELNTFPYVEAVLPHYITSPNDGMGLLEFAVDDVVRNSFANPAKSNLVNRNHFLLSGNIASYQVESRTVTSGSGASETSRHEKGSQNIFPIGGIYRIGSLRVGGLALYSSAASYARNHQSGVGPPTSFDLDLKGSGYPFEIIVGLSLSENVGFGAAYNRSDITTSGSFSFSNQVRQREQSTTGSQYKLGMIYSLSGMTQLSVLGAHYELLDDLTDSQPGNPVSFHGEKTTGWVLQGEYRRVIQTIGEFSIRATIDIKKMNERSAAGSTTDSESESEATVVQLGLGGVRTEGNLIIAGEILLEPASMTTYSPNRTNSSLSTEWKFSNWRARLGFGVMITEWLKWKMGTEYRSFRNSSRQTSDANSIIVENNPYASQGRIVFTTGVELQFHQFRVLYNFLYSSSTYTGLLATPSNNFNFLAPFEVKPSTHRISLSYEIE